MGKYRNSCAIFVINLIGQKVRVRLELTSCQSVHLDR